MAEEDIDKQRGKLESVTEVANWLIVRNKDNPQFAANVKAKLKSIEEPMKEISHVIDDRRKSLETVLLEKQDGESITELYECHLKDIEKLQRKRMPISVMYEKLKQDDEEEKVNSYLYLCKKRNVLQMEVLGCSSLEINLDSENTSRFLTYQIALFTIVARLLL